MKTSYARRIGAVVLTASILFLSCLKSKATQQDSYPEAQKPSVYINTGAPTSTLRVGIGRTVYFPHQDMYNHPEILKLAFEIVRKDDDHEGDETFDMPQLNFRGLGIQCGIIVNEDEYWDNAGLLYDFAVKKAVYTDELVSPEVNKGAFICPYDSQDKIIDSLVGTSILDKNAVSMHGGIVLIHSNPSVKVHKVKVSNMPFILNNEAKYYIQQGVVANPGAKVRLKVDCYAYVDYLVDAKNGYTSVLGFFRTKSFCSVYYDGRIMPDPEDNADFKFGMLTPDTVTISDNGSLSWLGIYASTDPSVIGNLVDLEACHVTTVDKDKDGNSIPPSLVISGLPTTEERLFYRVATLVPPRIVSRK